MATKRKGEKAEPAPKKANRMSRRERRLVVTGMLEGSGIDPALAESPAGHSITKATKLLREAGLLDEPKRTTAKRRAAQVKARRAGPDGKPRRCHGLNSAGEPCKSPPLRKGTEIDGHKASGGYCLRHDASLPDDCWKRFIQKGSRAAAARRRQPRPFELVEQMLRQQPKVMFDPFFRTLGYEWDPDEDVLVKIPGGGAKIVGFSREGIAKVSKHDDLGAMREAAKDLQNRLYGKPRQAMELAASGAAGAVVIPNDPQRNTTIAKVLIEAGAVDDKLALEQADND